MKKRLVSLVLVFLMLMSALSPGVFAAGTDIDTDLEDMYKIQFFVDSVTVANEDETATVSIRIEKNGGFAGMLYQILFDKDVFSLESQPVASSKIADFYSGGPLDEEGQHTGIVASEENILGDGILLTYTFKINPQASAGTHEIKLLTSGNISLPDGQTMQLEVLDENYVSIETEVENGSVAIPGYAVKYDANGGAGAPEGTVKSKNKPVVISSAVPSKEGHQFLGWATTPDAEAVEYRAGDKYTENKDVTFYAVWKKAALVEDKKIDISVETVGAKAGENISIDIDIAEGHPGFGGMSFDVVYDSEVLEYTGYTKVMNFNGLMEVTPIDKCDGKISFNILTSVENVTDIGTLVSVNFKVLDTVQDGTYEVSFVPGLIFKYVGENADESLVNANVTNGGIQIINEILGDVNLDEVVDMNDAILLLQHSMFPSLFVIEYKGSVDFNKDGVVDMNDAILLLQHSMFPGLFPLN